MLEHLRYQNTAPFVTSYVVRKYMPWLLTFGHCGAVDIYRVPTLAEAELLLGDQIDVALQAGCQVGPDNTRCGHFHIIPDPQDNADNYELFIVAEQLTFSLN